MVLKCFEGFADNMEDAFVCKINHQFILKVFFFPPKKKEVKLITRHQSLIIDTTEEKKECEKTPKDTKLTGK